MATNLQKVPDHPANLLDARMSEDPMLRDFDESDEGNFLRTYEDDHRVIFAALDVDALLHLRAVYAAYQNKPGQFPAFEVCDAVRDLLGLDD